MKLIEKKQETLEVTTFIFMPEEPIVWKAGQLLHYTLPHSNPDDRGIERYFTISSAPHEGHIALTTRFAGEKTSSFKRALFALPIGATIEADGLEGDFTVDSMSTPLVFIAGGIGITPYRSILLDLDKKGASINVKLLYASRDENAIFKDELEQLQRKHEHLTIRYYTDPERIDADAIRAQVQDLQEPIFYVSGPKPMVKAFVPLMIDMGIKDERILRDFFPNYEVI